MKIHQILILSVLLTEVFAPWVIEKQEKWEKWKQEAWGVRK
jgi:hypothetical protein